MGATIIVLAAIVIGGLIVLFYAIGLYNQLVSLRVNIDKSWANIDVLQKQRYDEIPKLVKVCEGYMKHERETLEKITQARTQFMSAKSPGEVAQADNMLAGALKTLYAVSENYPDLKANQGFLQLQGRVSALENQIADRREFYNESVTLFNTRILQIPYNFVAGMLNYQPKEMYKVADAEKAPPDINFQFPK